MRRARRARPALVAGALLAVVASGCGGSDGPKATALSRALADVRATPDTETFVQFGDAEGALALSGQQVDERGNLQGRPIARWGRLLGFGAPIAGVPGYADSTGIVALHASTLLTAGPPGAEVTVVRGGLDPTRVRSRLGRLGLHEHDGVLEAGRGGARSGFGAAVLHGDGVALGRAAAQARLAFGDGSSLAHARLPRAAARCLGDVVAAQMVGGRRPYGRDVPLLAVGVVRPAMTTSPVHEVLCAAARDGAGADRLVAGLRRGLGREGRLQRNDGPVEPFVRSARVSRADQDGVPMARAELVLQPQQVAGFLFASLQLFDVPGLGAPSR